MASAKDIENRIPITGALMLATLMNTLDSTIANVALPHMQGSISASADQIIWVLTSYIIATALMTPLSGWLSQKIGRKRMLILSIGGFTIASMLCGIATNLPELVVFRLLQGIAGASLIPLSQTVMLDMYPMSMIPRVMSLWSAAVILGPIIGPSLGGWITENLSWRWVFYINLPIGILATLGVLTFMDKDDGGRQRPFDVLGFTALAAFIGGFQLMMDRGPSQDWFYSREIWFWCATMAIGLWVFVVQTATAEHPFFHRDLAKDRNFIMTVIFSLFTGMLLFSTTALLPSFMQSLLGYSALESGIISMPRGVGSLIAFLAVPMFVARFGPRTTLAVGLTLSIAALWVMSMFDLGMDSHLIMISGFVQGVGTGLLFAPLNTLAYATLAQHHRVEGTIVMTMARSLGSSAGISAVQALVIRDSIIGHARLAESIDPANPIVRNMLPRGMDPGTVTGLSMLNGEVTRQGSMMGYVTVFAWMAAGCAVMFPLIMLLRPAKAPPMGGAPRVEAHAE